MSMLRSYVPSAVSCSIFGIGLDGFSAETVVVIERLEAATTFRKAMDGSGTAFLDRYGTYRVTFHLDQTSESNTILHLIFKIYQMSGINLSMPLMVQDQIGSTSLISVDTFFENEAGTTYNAESDTSTWTFICHNASYTKGGTVESQAMYAKLQSIVSFASTLQTLTQGLDIDVSALTNKLSDGLSNAIEEFKNII